MKRGIKTFLVVVLLTAVIWGWAEQSQTRTLDKQTITLHVRLPAGSGFAIYQEDKNGVGSWTDRIQVKVVASFTGQQGGINQLARLLRAHEYPPVYSLSIDPQIRENPRDRQKVAVNLLRALGDSPVLDRLNVTVASASPEQPDADTIMIEPLRQVEVDLVAKSHNEPVSGAVLQPAKAKVELPAGLVAKAVGGEISLDANLLGELTDAGGQFEAVVGSEVNGYPVRPNPERAKVTVKPKETGEPHEYEWPGVPLEVSVKPPFPYDQFGVIIQGQPKMNLKVRVAGNLSEAEARKRTRMYVELDDKDPKETVEPQTYTVKFDHPKEVTILVPAEGSSACNVQIRFIKRKAEPPP